MRLNRYFLRAALFAALMFLLPSLLLAQSVVTGALNGTVTDPSNAVVVGATVTLTSTTTGEALVTRTSTIHKFAESGDENAIESIFFASRTIRGFDVYLAQCAVGAERSHGSA